ncbi:preprotein translocase subunit SecE [Aggregatilinea lenta]|uniref:preprotein translocase subunit SecE n=1 Tax=Aggregatilinea lenta TaxID=913108 RepID=UPI001EE7B4DB|nr:preprotein translocase subunit SecE [Aggregatilinea lenta]
MARTRTRSLDQPDENTEHEVEVMSDSRRRRRRDAAVESTEQSVTRQDGPASSPKQVKPRANATSPSLVSRIPVVRGIVAYFRGVANELSKVTWPNRDETVRLTSVVLAVTIAFAVVLGLLDTFLAWWFQQAFSADSETIFLAIAAVALVISGGAYVFLRDRI